MSKFSVKKPFTVFVAVVIILVTGIVSYTKMTPDLFPNIDMPYVIVVTPYAGATPEKVENNVTKPLEQRLATLTDIKDLQSVSNANYSMAVSYTHLQEIIHEFKLKIAELWNIRQYKESIAVPGCPLWMHVMLGGVKENGRDACKMCIRDRHRTISYEKVICADYPYVEGT